MSGWLVLVLTGSLMAPQAPAAEPIRLRVAGTPSAEALRGIAFGIEEMDATARLLGRAVHRADTTADDADGTVVAGGLPPPPSKVPAIFLAQPRGDRTRCDFSVAAPDTASVRWHPSLDRFGASELNDRFARRYGAPMSDEAWAGWAAVKALVESALRRAPGVHPCEALATLRFDGHKGRALTFDPETGILAQPTYIVKDGRVTGEHK